MTHSEELLPALIKDTAGLLNRVITSAVPTTYHAPTSGYEIEQARREFENHEYLGLTLSEIINAYDWAMIRARGKLNESADNGLKNDEHFEPQPETFALQMLTSRNYLEEYRKKTGLSHLREKLYDSLAHAFTFERGLEVLEHHLDTLSKEKKGSQMTTHHYDKRTKLNKDERVKRINDRYPNMTAHEVTILSLCDIPKEGWLYDEPAFVNFPQAMVGMDTDGVHFAFGTIDGRGEIQDMEPRTHFEIGGITRASDAYQLARFNPNVSQILRTLILLSVDDEHLFKKMWNSGDICSMQRGDLQLVRTFIKNHKTGLPEDFDNRKLDDLIKAKVITRDDIEQARTRVAAFYVSSTFESPYLEKITDFVRLVGLLERTPQFMDKSERFTGYVKPYGHCIDFISRDGQIVDSVPLAKHLKHSMSYEFLDHAIDSSKKNKVMEKVFKDLQSRLQNGDSDNTMLSADAMQGYIFDQFGIFCPTDIQGTEKKMEIYYLMRTTFAESTVMEYTIKFALSELYDVAMLLREMPVGMPSGLRSVFKEISDAYTIDAMTTGFLRGGYYDFNKKRVVVSVPMKTPLVNRNQRAMENLLMVFRGEHISEDNEDSKTQQIKKHIAQFQHTFLHEMGEHIWAHLPEHVKDGWTHISRQKTKKQTAAYLTLYSKENEKEDFCESFAIYYTHGLSFSTLASKNKILARKFNFMKTMWSADGTERSFSAANRGKLPLRILHPSPDRSLDELLIDEAERSFKDSQEEYRRNEYERMLFGDRAISYEDIVEDIQELEGIDNNPIRAAVERRDNRAHVEEVEDLARKLRVKDFVIHKTEVAVRKCGVTFGIDILNFCKLIHDGHTDIAVQLLQTEGITKRKAANVIKEVASVYREFEEDLDFSELAKIEDIDGKKQKDLIMGMVELVLRQKKKK